MEKPGALLILNCAPLFLSITKMATITFDRESNKRSVLARQAEKNLIASLQSVIDGHIANQRYGDSLAAVVVCQHSGVADMITHLERVFPRDKIMQITPSRYAILGTNEEETGWLGVYTAAFGTYLQEKGIVAGVGFARYRSDGLTAKELYDFAVHDLMIYTTARMHAKKDLRE